jgi:uncharacterized protein (DUF433 family)
MQLEDYFDFQRSDDIRLRGTRVGIENILYEYLYCSRSPEEIVNYFNSITLEQIYATILYYLHNQTQLQEYMKNWIEHGNLGREKQRLNPPPISDKLRKVKAQRETY